MAKSPFVKEGFSGYLQENHGIRFEIPLDISKEELNRRIFAFGDSDGNIFPYLISNAKKYRLAFDTDHPDRHSIWLHDTRFVIE